MRSADLATLSRIPLMMAIVYMIIGKLSALLIVFLIAFLFALDVYDGYLAVRDVSNGKISLVDYAKSSFGDKRLEKKVKSFKEVVSQSAPHGPRMDIAGDRIIEYSFWVVYTYLNLLPLYVLLVVIIRHSLVDALMGRKGTSTKMKTNFAKLVYSSNLGRGGVNVLKMATFAYLALIYVAGYPVFIGYILTALLLAYILLRGAAEVWESFA